MLFTVKCFSLETGSWYPIARLAIGKKFLHMYLNMSLQWLYQEVPETWSIKLGVCFTGPGKNVAKVCK